MASTIKHSRAACITETQRLADSIARKRPWETADVGGFYSIPSGAFGCLPWESLTHDLENPQFAAAVMPVCRVRAKTEYQKHGPYGTLPVVTLQTTEFHGGDLDHWTTQESDQC